MMEGSGPVAHIITGLETGGAEILLLRLLERLPEAERGAVIVLRGRGALSEQVEALGVPVQHLGLRSLPGLRDVAKISDAVAAADPSVAQTWLIHGNVLGGFGARRAGVPVVWGVHSSGVTRATHGTASVVFQAAERRLSRRVPDAIVACSDSAAEFMRTSGYATDRISVIRNGFDLARFHPDAAHRASVRDELGIGLDTPVVGHVGRFHPMKDHHNLLAAAELVVKQVPAARFVLVGSGLSPDNAELAEWAAPLGDAVSLLGRRSDTERLYRAFDVTVLSSAAGEALPLVIGEAMASGSPFVSTDGGDAAAIIGDTGRVVARSSPQQLADAISELLAMGPEGLARLGARARRRISDEYSLDGMVAAYRGLWDGLG